MFTKKWLLQFWYLSGLVAKEGHWKARESGLKSLGLNRPCRFDSGSRCNFGKPQMNIVEEGFYIIKEKSYGRKQTRTDARAH